MENLFYSSTYQNVKAFKTFRKRPRKSQQNRSAGLTAVSVWSEGYLPVPVGEGHHNIERGQEEHKVEEGVAVLNPVLLVVLHALGSSDFLWKVGGAAATLSQDDRVFGGHGQLVHLAGAGGPNAETKQIYYK